MRQRPFGIAGDWHIVPPCTGTASIGRSRCLQPAEPEGSRENPPLSPQRCHPAMCRFTVPAHRSGPGPPLPLSAKPSAWRPNQIDVRAHRVEAPNSTGVTFRLATSEAEDRPRRLCC
jgi:hypothetical protein